MTRENVKMSQTVARLIVLGSAFDSFNLPAQIAARWVSPCDLAAFEAELEECVRGLADLYQKYLDRNPGVLDRCQHDDRLMIWDIGIEDTRKLLAKLDRIAEGKVELNVGACYLPVDLQPDLSAEAEELRKLRNGELRL